MVFSWRLPQSGERVEDKWSPTPDGPDGNSWIGRLPKLSPFRFERTASLCIISRVFEPHKASQGYKSECSKSPRKKLQVFRTFYLPYSVSRQVRIQVPIQEKGRDKLYLMGKWCICLRKKKKDSIQSSWKHVTIVSYLLQQ